MFSQTYFLFRYPTAPEAITSIRIWKAPLQEGDSFLFVVSTFFLIANLFRLDTRSHNKIVTCYVASWAAYRPGKGAFTVDNIDPTLCTHIIYTFAGLNNATYAMHSMDPFLDTTDDGGRGKLF